MLLLMNNINKEINLPSKKKDIYCHGSQTYLPTIIMQVIYWSPFLTIMQHTTDNIETKITLVPSLLKVFAMFQIYLFLNKENHEENVVDTIAIKCSNCGKTAGLYVKIYQLQIHYHPICVKYSVTSCWYVMGNWNKPTIGI